MKLEEALKKVNNQIKKSMANIKLEELIGSDEYSNYTLFDLINYFKIRRMRELGTITALEERDLFTCYRKYNTKLFEKKNINKIAEKRNTTDTTSLLNDIDEDIKSSKEALELYGIDPDKTKPLIKIEDMVILDILSRTHDEIKKTETKILKKETIDKINTSFSSKVLNFDIEEISFIKIYNLLKIELLAEMKYIPKNIPELIYELYNKFFVTGDKIIYKELSKDPYNLVFGKISFDFVNYIDYTIKKNYTDRKEENNYLSKVVK